ncbi:hypothetical protein KUCAC02_015936 [Chaenocephalus aceratus]|uniref:Uncharacterized protein n=1 Tax=Chaenocephalus aceratus TaxID=36190 RepID=A0ACB9Y0T5_CHAAC|nr:hypothetical protein KUCAC02_015936 [Chaenocephalus aceratus]
MGGKLTCHQNSKERRHISVHIADIIEMFTPLYQRHLSSNLLIHMRNTHIEPISEPRPLIQHPDVVAHAGIVLEGTLPLCVDGIWIHCHLRLNNSFTLESHDSKQVFEGGGLVDDMCRHIKCKSGKELTCWDCPTAFPVFMHHPYRAPVCPGHQEQTRWANMLRAAAQHQSPALWCEASPDTRAFLDAVSSLKRLRGNCQTEVHPVGDGEERCEPMLKSLQHMVIPKLDRTLQEVAAPTWDGFASTWQYFLETYDARMWKCLDGLEGVCGSRRHGVSTITAVLCRIRERVIKHLETELLALRSQLILEAILQITLHVFTRGVVCHGEHAFYIHPDIVFHSILRENLTAYIQSVMRNFLYQLMPLPVSSSSSLSETAHNKLLPPTDCMQNLCHTSEGSTSGSETLTPSINSGNAVNHTSSLLDAGEYICLTD